MTRNTIHRARLISTAFAIAAALARNETRYAPSSGVEELRWAGPTPAFEELPEGIADEGMRRRAAAAL